MYPDAVGGVVYDYFMPSVSVDSLLKTEGQIRVLTVIPEHRIKILYYADLPVTVWRDLADGGWRHSLISLAKRAGVYMWT